MGSRDIVKLFIVPLFIGKTGKWLDIGKDTSGHVRGAAGNT